LDANVTFAEKALENPRMIQIRGHKKGVIELDRKETENGGGDEFLRLLQWRT
jgi:hypothetical protein